LPDFVHISAGLLKLQRMTRWKFFWDQVWSVLWWCRPVFYLCCVDSATGSTRSQPEWFWNSSAEFQHEKCHRVF